MQLKTIEQLEKEIADLQSELDQTIDEKRDLEKECDSLKDDVRLLESENDELKNDIENLENAEKEYDYDHTTVVGKMMYACDNMPDNDTMELFMELMYKVRPADLQTSLKELIAKHGVNPMYAPAA